MFEQYDVLSEVTISSFGKKNRNYCNLNVKNTSLNACRPLFCEEVDVLFCVSLNTETSQFKLFQPQCRDTLVRCCHLRRDECLNMMSACPFTLCNAFSRNFSVVILPCFKNLISLKKGETGQSFMFPEFPCLNRVKVNQCASEAAR